MFTRCTTIVSFADAKQSTKAIAIKSPTPDTGNLLGLPLDSDLDAVREKYRRERDKRLRTDGSSQYRKLTSDATYSDVDPYVDPGFTRAPIEEEKEVVIIGGGFGGTWYWNRYPGVQCDVESYVYMPLLEELGTIPTEKYAHGRRSSRTPRRSAVTTTSTRAPHFRRT